MLVKLTPERWSEVESVAVKDLNLLLVVKSMGRAAKFRDAIQCYANLSYNVYACFFYNTLCIFINNIRTVQSSVNNQVNYLVL
jgi:hypothetical protein